METRGSAMRVWSWGAGSHGQLASGALVDAVIPQQVESLSRRASPVVHVACGGAHALAVFGSGEVATWGRGQAGALGHGDETSAAAQVPRFVSSLQGIRILRAAAGWNHSAFLTDNGELYTCGDGTFGQLGHGDAQPPLQQLPRRVEHLSAVRIDMVACGMRHTLALSAATPGSPDSSIVYAFGFNKRGQLGLGMGATGRGSATQWRVQLPRRVDALDLHGVASVSANGDHSGALTETGALLLWGRGYNDGPDSPLPRLVHTGQVFCQLSLGWRHGLALTDSKEVFAWGNNRCGQLGVSRAKPTTPADGATTFGEPLQAASTPAQRPTTVAGVSLQRVETGGLGAVWISAGSEHSAAVLEDGSVVLWGWAEHGQLGLGSLEDQMAPHIVSLASQERRNPPDEEAATPADSALEFGSSGSTGTRVYCGSGSLLGPASVAWVLHSLLGRRHPSHLLP